MAVGWVQDWAGVASTTGTATITGTALTANNWMVFCIRVLAGVTVTPPAGPTSVLTKDDGTEKIEVFIFKAVGGETSFAFTESGTNARLIASEFTAILATSPTDVTASAQTASATSCSTGVTAATAQADEMAIAFIGTVNAYTAESCATGFTLGSRGTASSTRTSLAWKVLSATGTQEGTWSWTTARTSVSAIICLKGLAPAGGGGTAMWVDRGDMGRRKKARAA